MNSNDFMYKNGSNKSYVLNDGIGPNDYALGESLCKSGAGQYQYGGFETICGPILAEDQSFPSPSFPVLVEHQTVVEVDVWGGDSGATIFGIGVNGTAWAGSTSGENGDETEIFVSIPKEIKQERHAVLRYDRMLKRGAVLVAAFVLLCAVALKISDPGPSVHYDARPVGPPGTPIVTVRVTAPPNVP